MAIDAQGSMLLFFSDAGRLFRRFASGFFCLLREDGSVLDFLLRVRAAVVAPVMRAAIVACLVMSTMLFLEALLMSVVSLWVKILRLRPEKRYKWEPMVPATASVTGDDLENGSQAFPMVLVQIPMYNEREVYKLSIGAACALTWPPDRIIIQVLDDSTDPSIKELVRTECAKWACMEVNVKYEVRDNRRGYKAGALKKGMQQSYVDQCEFVVIFDADFQPQSDFLLKTIPFLVHNPTIALVQTRWDFVNYDASMLTRIQKMSLDYHFKVEQEYGSSTFAFFGFNGTAGVWRVSAIREAGGWNDRTTVEDMDLAVRASLRGWKFLYLGNVKVKSELPCTLNAYRRQQHRWTCGPANLFRKVAWDVAANKEMSVGKKLHLLYGFFFVRKVVAPTVTFLFYCAVIPLSIFIPEARVPTWGLFYIPTTITALVAIRNLRYLHVLPFWILFENVMSMHRMRSAMAGLLEGSYVDEWVVTEKLGGHLNTPLLAPLAAADKTNCTERLHTPELVVAAFLILCATYDIAFGGVGYYAYIYLQALTFSVVGFGFVGSGSTALSSDFT